MEVAAGAKKGKSTGYEDRDDGKTMTSTERRVGLANKPSYLLL
jgi:hypothetical protein